MKTKISNIREMTLEEKKKILGVKYRVTLVILCREHLKRFDLEYVPKFSDNSDHNRVECPLCGLKIRLPSGESLNREIKLPALGKIKYLSNPKDPHIFEKEDKVEIGLYEQKKRK